jgi:hypothetical protein
LCHLGEYGNCTNVTEKRDAGKYVFKSRRNWEAEDNKVKLFLEDKGGYTEKSRRFWRGEGRL